MINSTRTRGEIARRYLVFTIAIFFIALGVSLITRSFVGTSPISSVPFVAGMHTPFSMGTWIFVLNVVLMGGQMLMLGAGGIKRCRVELVLQLPVSVVFGCFVDMTMFMLEAWHPDVYAIKLTSLLAGCLSMAFGVSLEVIADVAMVSGEYFVHIASHRFKTNFGTVKIMFDATLVALAVILSLMLSGTVEGVREGTLAAALLTGPLVRVIMPHLGRVGDWQSDGRDDTSAAAARQ